MPGRAVDWANDPEVDSACDLPWVGIPRGSDLTSPTRVRVGCWGLTDASDASPATGAAVAERSPENVPVPATTTGRVYRDVRMIARLVTSPARRRRFGYRDALTRVGQPVRWRLPVSMSSSLCQPCRHHSETPKSLTTWAIDDSPCEPPRPRPCETSEWMILA